MTSSVSATPYSPHLPVEKAARTNFKRDIVSWTLDVCDYDQHKPLYIDPINEGRSITAASTRSTVRQLCSGFQAEGVLPGDCVSVITLDDIHYSALMLGIIGAGGIYSGANPSYTAPELLRHFQITKTKYVLTSLKALDAVLVAAKSYGLSSSHIYILNWHNKFVPHGHESWTRLLEYGESDWIIPAAADKTVAAYLSTSGTSGLPKIALIPHSYLISQGETVLQLTGGNHLRNRSVLITTPPFHAFTIPLQHLLPLVTGNPCYVLQRFDIQDFLFSCQRFTITDTAVVPLIMTALARSDKKAELSSFRKVYTAGSAATKEMQARLYKILDPSAIIIQVFGMTECGWASSWQYNERDTSGSIGQPLPGFQMRLTTIDTSKAITTPATLGEIGILVPRPMLGYHCGATAFSGDGWLKTGDIGYFLRGTWFIVDRKKDLIKVRGWQVSPVEIEAALMSHPRIADCAVVGVPALALRTKPLHDTMSLHRESGELDEERPVAFVVSSQADHWTSKLDENNIKDHLQTRIARYKMIAEVRFVSTIPRNAAGKMLKSELRNSIMHTSPDMGSASSTDGTSSVPNTPNSLDPDENSTDAFTPATQNSAITSLEVSTDGPATTSSNQLASMFAYASALRGFCRFNGSKILQRSEAQQLAMNLDESTNTIETSCHTAVSEVEITPSLRESPRSTRKRKRSLDAYGAVSRTTPPPKRQAH